MKKLAIVFALGLTGCVATPVIEQGDGTYVLNWRYNAVYSRKAEEPWYIKKLEETCPQGYEMLDEDVLDDPYSFTPGGRQVVWEFRCAS